MSWNESELVRVSKWILYHSKHWSPLAWVDQFILKVCRQYLLFMKAIYAHFQFKQISLLITKYKDYLLGWRIKFRYPEPHYCKTIFGKFVRKMHMDLLETILTWTGKKLQKKLFTRWERFLNFPSHLEKADALFSCEYYTSSEDTILLVIFILYKYDNGDGYIFLIW